MKRRPARAPLPPGPAARAAELVWIASYGASFDEVLVHGSEDLIQVFLDRGFRPIHRSDRLLLARFEGCPTRHAEGGGTIRCELAPNKR